MNFKPLLVGVFLGMIGLCITMPANAQWSITPNTTNWSYNPNPNNPADLMSIFTFGSGWMFIEKVDPVESATISATYSWNVTWNGSMPPQESKTVKCDMTAWGYANTQADPNTASGSSDIDGSGGTLHLNYPPFNTDSVTYAISVNNTTTLRSTVLLVLTNVYNGQASATVNYHF